MVHIYENGHCIRHLCSIHPIQHNNTIFSNLTSSARGIILVVNKSAKSRAIPSDTIYMAGEDYPEGFSGGGGKTLIIVDWKNRGAVTKVKNQKPCHNADWAFAAVGALEGQLFVKYNISVELSAQELIDCSKKNGNFGCKGGSVQKAFDYIMDNGISTEQSYPYNGTEAATCLNKSEEKIAKGYSIKFEKMENNSESVMRETLDKHGPILAIIDGSLGSFQNYTGGTYEDEKCAKVGKHNVLIVGYGETQHQDKKYWIVKNSWGEDWGEKGYFKIAREKNNTCGIASNASYIEIHKPVQILVSLF